MLFAAGMLGAVAIAGTAPQAAGNPEPSEPYPWNADTLKPSLPFEYDAKSVEDFAASHDALGQYYDEQNNVYVVRVPPSWSASNPPSAASLSVPVALRPSAMSRLQVADAQKAIEVHSRQPEHLRYKYVSYYDARTDRIKLLSDNPAVGIRRLLDQYPMIDYKEAPVSNDSRQFDTAPHWGAASITSNTGALCSSGFTVQTSAGVRRMTTAGHCYYEGGYGASFSSTGGGGSFGTIGIAPPGRDIGWLGGSTYGAHIYVGGSEGIAKHVDGAGNPATGITGYCVSGQTSFEHCNLHVYSLNGQKCDSYSCTYGLIAYGPGDTLRGDSGGPFYAYTTGGTHVHIRGMHVALVNGVGLAERWSTIAAYGYSIVR